MSTTTIDHDTEQDVPQGYKRTEFGVIPGTWEQTPLSRLLDFKNGVNAGKRAYGNGVRFANVLEVITFPHLQAKTIPGRINIPKELIDSFLVKQGDVLFNRTSETQEEVGLASVYMDTEVIVFGGFVIRGRPKTVEMDSRYAGYALRAPTVRTQIIKKGQGAIRANIGQSDLREVFVPLPPPPEQRAIAAALSDVDALLTALDALIAKKRAVKQATMQQLLTGAKRLPGFEGEWERINLGELFTFKNGLNKGKSYFGFGTSIVNYMDVFHDSKIYSSQLKGRVSLTPQEIQNFNVKKGDVFFTRTSETIDEIGMAAVILDVPEQTVYSGFVLRARPKDNRLNDLYKAYCFRSKEVRAQIISKASYTTRALTNGRILSAVVIPVPRPEEQEAIATVLYDMDAEIETLERRREKTRQIKQGMMQQLLTGRVRLLQPTEAGSEP